MNKRNAKKKDDKPFLGRDWLILEIVKGATKAGVEKDQKKEANKRRCREKVRLDKDE